MNEDSICIKNDKLVIGNESISLYKISNIRATEKKPGSIFLNVFIVALVISSISWVLPFFDASPTLSLYLSVVLFGAGIMLGLFIVKRFSLEVEIKHQDDTGIQWSTVAKSNKKNDHFIFIKAENEVKEYLMHR